MVNDTAGDFNGVRRPDAHEITINPPHSSPRSFVGLLGSVTWEFEKRPCLYVGNSQAGPLGEDVEPNDSVIEGTYKDYEVASLFSTSFTYSQFNTGNCDSVAN